MWTSLPTVCSGIAEWTDAGGDTVGGVTPVPAGVRRRRYAVAMRVTYTDGNIVSEVTGEQLFYAEPRAVELSGRSLTLWDLFLWRDFGNTQKAVESTTWGQVKSLY